MSKKKFKNSKSKRKVKIKYNRIFIFLLIIMIIILFLNFLFNLKITNIYITGNDLVFNDQEIIDIALISDYPKTLTLSRLKIKNNLENNIYIKSAKVTKKFLTQVYIEVEENYPLFFYKPDNKTILLDGSKVDMTSVSPTVVNYIPNLKYQSFVEKMGLLDHNILERISAIKYDPNDYDDERFLLYMKDGNYVYINLYKFHNLNKYIEIIKNFGNKKGIVYLDSGNYFEIIEK